MNFIPGTGIELIDPAGHQRPRAAVFDFDGTLSLIRGGWTDLMVDMMMETLIPLQREGESREELSQLTRQFILSLNGAPTRFQMERFVEEIESREGQAEPATVYHEEYLRRLGQRIRERKALLQSGGCGPDDLMVPGSRAILQELINRGIELTLASGTEIEFVREEAGLLGILPFFEGRIFAPGHDPHAFSKKNVMEKLLNRLGIPGPQLLSFGDGQVETQSVTELGGLAVGVACQEATRDGTMDVSKRPTLVAAGAKILVPDYREARPLLDWIWQAARE